MLRVVETKSEAATQKPGDEASAKVLLYLLNVLEIGTSCFASWHDFSEYENPHHRHPNYDPVKGSVVAAAKGTHSKPYPGHERTRGRRGRGGGGGGGRK